MSTTHEGTPYEIVQFMVEGAEGMPTLVGEYMLAVAVRCQVQYRKWIDSSDPAEFLRELAELGVIRIIDAD